VALDWLALLATVLIAFSKWLSRFALWLTQEGLKHAAPNWNLSLLRNFVGPLRMLLSVSLFRAGMDGSVRRPSCAFTWADCWRCSSFGVFSGCAR